jgi:hypothetical protein
MTVSISTGRKLLRPREHPFNQILKPAPELAKLAFCGDEGVVNQEEVGDESELLDGSGDRLLDLLDGV